MDKFSIKEFKKRGLKNYKREFVIISLSMIVFMTVGANFSGLVPNVGFIGRINVNIFSTIFPDKTEGVGINWSNIIATIIVSLLVAIVIGFMMVIIIFAFGSFLGAPAGVGMKYMFMKLRKGSVEFKDGIEGIGNGNYMKIVETMFFANLRIWLWSFLFIIPGIIKYYELYFVSYIVACNPTISAKRALEISKEMSSGHKKDIFAFELSFIGWYILVILLCLCTCGLGGVMIIPLLSYIEASKAEMYTERREYAIIQGITDEKELPYII